MSDPDWMRLALWVAKRHADRADADDIRQIALISAWSAVQKTRGTGCPEKVAAVRGAEWGVQEHLRHQPGGKRAKSRAEVSLESLIEERGEEWAPAQPDFAAAVIERLWLWQEAERRLSIREREALWRVYVTEQTYEEAAAAMGISRALAGYVLKEARRKLSEAIQ